MEKKIFWTVSDMNMFIEKLVYKLTDGTTIYPYFLHIVEGKKLKIRIKDHPAREANLDYDISILLCHDYAKKETKNSREAVVVITEKEKLSDNLEEKILKKILKIIINKASKMKT